MMVTKEWTWDMAHRLVKNYQGKCQHLHGHTYKVEVCVEGAALDRYDMTIDFTTIADHMKKWVMDTLDHATMVCIDDSDLLRFLQNLKQKHYPIADNSTAEHLARMLFGVFSEQVKIYLNERSDASRDLHIRYVRVWETPTSSAVCNG